MIAIYDDLYDHYIKIIDLSLNGKQTIINVTTTVVIKKYYIR